MFCQKCGKEIPDGAMFCSFCGAPVPEPSPRHAKPDPEELYSYSDEQIHVDDALNRDMDATRVFDPNDGVDDATKVYNFENFEDNGQGYYPDDRYMNEPEPLNDSYENYQDGLDDDTFMDKMDNAFRRDRDDYDDYDDYNDGRPPKKKSKLWLWITLGVVAIVLMIVFAILAFSGTLFGNKKATPTVAPTAATVAKATTAPKPTKAPETQAPETQPPATEPPATEPPATEAPPITEAPQTEAPPTEAPPTEAPATEAPVTEAP